jgi:hypothetical protein
MGLAGWFGWHGMGWNLSRSNSICVYLAVIFVLIFYNNYPSNQLTS